MDIIIYGSSNNSLAAIDMSITTCMCTRIDKNYSMGCNISCIIIHFIKS